MRCDLSSGGTTPCSRCQRMNQDCEIDTEFKRVNKRAQVIGTITARIHQLIRLLGGSRISRMKFVTCDPLSLIFHFWILQSLLKRHHRTDTTATRLYQARILHDQQPLFSKMDQSHYPIGKMIISACRKRLFQPRPPGCLIIFG